MSELTFTLLENGLDYLQSAVEHLESKEERRLKYAIRDLFSGISLAFKERLANESWCLLFENVDEADEKKLVSGHFQSVAFKNCILRLNQLEEEMISEEFENILYVLRDKRKNIEHYAISDNVNSLRSLSYKVLKFTLGFISNKLEVEGSEYSTSISKLREKIISYASYRKKRLIEIKGKLDEYDVIFKCPECFNETFPLCTENRTCLFCFHSEVDGESLAYSYRSNVLHISSYGIAKGRQDEVLENCLECGTESLILGFDDDGHICFECSEVYSHDSIDWCSKCGQIKSGSTEESICSDCWDNIMDKD
ncbi:MAG: hypothetical protein HOE90_07835 [Bacteriovoracaceae bacterium]|jgi:hypothetical protein|nr:hypothetical protein [Bacteriovoracaceae bacterium]